MNILFLYSEVMGYTEALFEAIHVLNIDAKVHCVHWDTDKKTPYKLSNTNVCYYARSNFKDEASLNQLVATLNPKIIYVSGWMDKLYKSVVKQQKSLGIPIVTGLDDQWSGSVRQYIASFLSFLFIKPYYDYAWVAGVRQYEYARRLGFAPTKILKPLYSANVDMFNISNNQTDKQKINHPPKRILFVGSFVEVKGIDLLVNSFKKLSTKFPEWELKIIGNGVLKSWIEKEAEGFNITVQDFLQPDKLVEEITNASFFCLPSTFEAWGVVVHEFAAAGMPLVVSNSCGSCTEFVVNNYNGYIFKSGDCIDLIEKLSKLMQKTQENLIEMGKKSFQLSQNITPKNAAAALLSIL